MTRKNSAFYSSRGAKDVIDRIVEDAAVDLGMAVGNPLMPSMSLLCKLGSIIVHADEYINPVAGRPDGRAFDLSAIQALLADDEVQMWVAKMGVYLPVKR